MGRGVIIADNWIQSVSTAVFDALTSTPVIGANTDLIDFESGVRVEYTAGGNTDIVIDFGAGVAVNPNSFAIVNHNLTQAAATFGSVTVTSADDAAQTVQVDTLASFSLSFSLLFSRMQNLYFALSQNSNGAKRYFRIRITDTSKTAADTIKIGQIILGSDQMTDPLDRTAYTAAGFAVNYNSGFGQPIFAESISNRTLGGELHEFSLTDDRFRFDGLTFEAVDATMLRYMFKIVGGLGIDRVTHANNEEPATPLARVPVLFCQDVASIECYYGHLRANNAVVPILNRRDPDTFDIGPFNFVEQGRGC